MKKLIASIVIVILLVAGVSNVAFAADGPAPNSGDGIHDGSGFEDKGAPNSGDDIPDGSGW